MRPRRARWAATLGSVVAAAAVVSCNDDDNYCCVQTFNVPNSVAIADVNGDGIADLLVATTISQGQQLNPGFANVILNSKSSPGTFSTGVRYPTTGWNPSSIAVADLTACRIDGYGGRQHRRQRLGVPARCHAGHLSTRRSTIKPAAPPTRS